MLCPVPLAQGRSAGKLWRTWALGQSLEAASSPGHSWTQGHGRRSSQEAPGTPACASNTYAWTCRRPPGRPPRGVPLQCPSVSSSGEEAQGEQGRGTTPPPGPHPPSPLHTGVCSLSLRPAVPSLGSCGCHGNPASCGGGGPSSHWLCQSSARPPSLQPPVASGPGCFHSLILSRCPRKRTAGPSPHFQILQWGGGWGQMLEMLGARILHALLHLGHPREALGNPQSPNIWNPITLVLQITNLPRWEHRHFPKERLSIWSRTAKKGGSRKEEETGPQPPSLDTGPQASSPCRTGQSSEPG